VRHKSFTDVEGQCSPSTWGKIQSEAGFDAIDAAKDHIELKRRIKGVCCGFKRHKQPIYALAQAIVLLATTFQENNESLNTYFRKFKASWDMITDFGGSLGHQPGLIEERVLEIANADQRAVVLKECTHSFQSVTPMTPVSVTDSCFYLSVSLKCLFCIFQKIPSTPSWSFLACTLHACTHLPRFLE
jgi:hypothetical protein